MAADKARFSAIGACKVLCVTFLGRCYYGRNLSDKSTCCLDRMQPRSARPYSFDLSGSTRRFATMLLEPSWSDASPLVRGSRPLYAQHVNDFARAILEGRRLDRGTLDQAWQVTKIFEAFAEGPGRCIDLAGTP